MTTRNSTSLDGGDQLQLMFLGAVAVIGLLALPAYTAIWLSSLLIGFHVLPMGHFSLAVGVELFAAHAALLKHWPAAQRSNIHPLAAEIFMVAIMAGAVWLGIRVRTKGVSHLGFQLPGHSGPRMKHDDGFATKAAIRKYLSKEAAAAKARFVRPDIASDLKGRRSAAYAFFLGKDKRSKMDVYASLEDTVLVIGPPRSGKGLHLINNFVAEAPGPVVATSTRPDTLRITARFRKRVGTCYVFDPQGTGSHKRLPVTPLRWDPIQGCANPKVGLARANAFATSIGLGGDGNAEFFEKSCRNILYAYFTAAGLAGKNLRAVLDWISAPDDREPVNILNRAGGEYVQIASQLAGAQADEPRLRSNVYSTTRTALDCFLDPDVLAACCPPPGQSFDPRRFLTERANSLYLIGSSSAQAPVAPLVVALIENIVAEARTLADDHEGSRLVPPLLLCLDEVANMAPIKKLPGILSDGSGSGISTVTVFQNMAQIRERWGNDGGGAIFEASACKVILGGLSNARDLEDLSAMFGDVWVPKESKGDSSASTSWVKERVLPVARIREIPFGEALVMHRAAPPVRINLVKYLERWWYTGPNGKWLPKAGGPQVKRPATQP